MKSPPEWATRRNCRNRRIAHVTRELAQRSRRAAGAGTVLQPPARHPALATPSRSRHRVSRRGGLPSSVPVPVVRRATELQITRLRSAVPRDRNDVIEFQKNRDPQRRPVCRST